LPEVKQAMLDAGLDIEFIGTHSIRKGAVTYVISGAGGGFAGIIAVLLRGGWHLEGITNRYFKFGDAGDQVLGRQLCGLPTTSAAIAAMLACFDFRLLPARALVDAALAIVYPNVPLALRPLVEHCLAALVRGAPRVLELLAPDAPLRAKPFFTDPHVVSALVPLIVSGNGVLGDHLPSVVPSGIPVLISLLGRLAVLETASAAVAPQVVAAVETSIDQILLEVRGLNLAADALSNVNRPGGVAVLEDCDVATDRALATQLLRLTSMVQGVESKVDKLHEVTVEQHDEVMKHLVALSAAVSSCGGGGGGGGGDGGGGLVGASGRGEELGERMDVDGVAAGGEEESCAWWRRWVWPQSARPEEERFVPETFAVSGKVSLRDLWLLYLRGNEVEGVRPWRFLFACHVPEGSERRMPELHAILGALLRVAARLGRCPAAPEPSFRPSAADAIAWYNECYPTLDVPVVSVCCGREPESAMHTNNSVEHR
jgi:hypothetical protein